MLTIFPSFFSNTVPGAPGVSYTFGVLPVTFWYESIISFALSFIDILMYDSPSMFLFHSYLTPSNFLSCPSSVVPNSVLISALASFTVA